jgi:hypothetical protein
LTRFAVTSAAKNGLAGTRALKQGFKVAIGVAWGCGS